MQNAYRTSAHETLEFRERSGWRFQAEQNRMLRIPEMIPKARFALARRRLKEIQRIKRNKWCEAWYSCPARPMERSHFPGAYWIWRRTAEDGASRAYRGQGLSSARRHIQSCGCAVRRAG